MARRDSLSSLAVLVTSMCVVLASCAQQLPGAPDAGAPLTISGYVYQDESAESGEPLLADVLITVQGAEGSPRTAKTNGKGFYIVSVPAGTISITASKEGYATRASNFDLSKSTVLNFSLTPTEAVGALFEFPYRLATC
jgi:carboxypeptidase family protein